MANKRTLAGAHMDKITIVAKTADATATEAIETVSPSKPVKRLMPPLNQTEAQEEKKDS